MEESDVRDLVREAVVLFQVSDPEIRFNVETPDEPVITLCDRRLISQAVTNLVKNATEAIEAAAVADKDGGYKGEIDAKVEVTGNRFVIEVTDNGIGLPAENRNRLVEPYMTTREKGTGLGLAIVLKITEQHGGTLQLRDAPKRNGSSTGASMRLDLPIVEPSQQGAHDEVNEGADKPGERHDVRGENQGASHGV
jgi:two-component system nitrogen regulation sensor histidine kinase NtrY